MTKYTVRESKIVLFIGFPYTAFFLGLYTLSVIYAVRYFADFWLALFFTLLFGGVSFPGIYLIVSYFRRRLTINGTQISYTPALGPTRTFSVNDIYVITLDTMASVKLQSQEGKRLACFELNMPGSCAALSYLGSQNITVIPSSSATARFSKSPKRQNSKAELHLKEEQDYILSRWDIQKIMSEKKAASILRILMAVLLVISFFTPQTVRLFCLALIPLFCYGMYLFFYPKMILDINNINKAYAYCRIPFPYLLCCFDAVFLLIFLARLNMKYLTFAFIYGLFLAVCYFLVLCIRKRRERIGKILSVLIAVFLLAIVTSPALNVAATFQDGTHTSVTVLDKKSHHSKHGKTYYLMVETQGEIQSYHVSKELYHSLDSNDLVTLCERRSIFGVTWIVLHQ